MKLDEDLVKYSESRKPGPSKVRRDKNKLAISVSNFVNHNRIRLKVKASYDKWLEWEDTYSSQGSIALDTVTPYISRPSKRDLSALQEYAKELPDHFAWEFFDLYICPSITNIPNHPHRSGRTGGSPPYGRDRKEILMIKYTAREIYACLQYWLKQPEESVPPGIRKLSGGKNDPVEAIKKWIERRYDISLPDRKTFYDKWIVPKTLRHIKKHVEFRGYIPRFPYILKLHKLKKTKS